MMQKTILTTKLEIIELVERRYNIKLNKESVKLSPYGLRAVVLE